MPTMSNPVLQTLDPKEIRAQLRRILASSEFAASPRMQDFLRLAVSEALAGRPDRLKEYVIGIEVFRRPSSFDPGIDPIVRVEARRLRAKLERFYSAEGRQDPLLIELPKGGYAPHFRARTASDWTAETPGSANRIAVLPFQALSATAEAQQFCDGLSWELTHRLTRIEGLTVVASASVKRIREGSPLDAAAAGSELGAATVLTGSVRESAGRIRVIAQMLAVATGVYLWSETYDRKLEDVFSIQDAIAHAIVSRLRLQLGSDEPPATPCRSAYNPEAYQLYLRGRARWNTRSEEGLRASLDLFQRAAELDPGFALAYAGIADAYALIADFAIEPPVTAMPSAKRAATRALELDGSLAEAHCSLAFQRSLYEWEWDDAELHYRHALDLNPGYATAHHWYSVDLLALLGRFEEAREEIELAIQLDPLSRIFVEGTGLILIMERRDAEAVAVLESLIRTDPGFYKGYTSMGRALTQLGLYDDAMSFFEKGRSLAKGIPSILGAMGQTLALSGRRDAARAVLAEMHHHRETRYVPSTAFALIHAALGEIESALEWLEKGVESREMAMTSMGIHPVYDTLRREPRFRALLRRMNLSALIVTDN